MVNQNGLASFVTKKNGLPSFIKKLCKSLSIIINTNKLRISLGHQFNVSRFKMFPYIEFKTKVSFFW